MHSRFCTWKVIFLLSKSTGSLLAFMINAERAPGSPFALLPNAEGAMISSESPLRNARASRRARRAPHPGARGVGGDGTRFRAAPSRHHRAPRAAGPIAVTGRFERVAELGGGVERGRELPARRAVRRRAPEVRD